MAKPNQQQYSLELGVDKPGEGRVCAVEAGPFERILDAKAFGIWARGKTAAELLDLPNVEAYDLPESEIRDQNYTIVGATLNVFTDLHGTLDNIDMY